MVKPKADSENSWTVNIADVNTKTYDLSVKNPHRKAETALREPREILDEMRQLDEASATALAIMKTTIKNVATDNE